MSVPKPPKPRLGRGLDALLAPPPSGAGPASGMFEVSVDLIDTQRQPRRHFDDEKLEELAASIQESGVIQPLIVRQLDGGRYMLVAGERRLRACRRVKLDKVPVIVRDMSDDEAWVVALIENVQREDLNAIEEAEALQLLIERFGLSQEEVAARVGRARPTIANTLRLLRLPTALRELVAAGRLSAGQARAVMMVGDDPKLLEDFATKVLEEGLTVRRAEELAREIRREEEARAAGVEPDLPPAAADHDAVAPETPAQPAPPEPLRPQLKRVERLLQESLSAHVTLQPNAKGGGTLTIRYASDDALQAIVDRVLGA